MSPFAFKQNLDNNGGGYHIHEYPLPYQFEAITDQCGSGSTGGHFNPFGATGYNPSQNSQATQELYEVNTIYTNVLPLPNVASPNIALLFFLGEKAFIVYTLCPCQLAICVLD